MMRHTFPLAMAPVLFAAAMVSPAAGADMTLYFLNSGTVYAVPPGGGTPSVYLSGIAAGASAMAFDSQGDLYVANALNNTVSEYLRGGGGPITFATGLNIPESLAFDSSGNLYIANHGLTGLASNTVSVVGPGGGVATTFATGVFGPEGLAFNSSGNLFISNEGAARSEKISVSVVGPGGGVATTFATNIGNPLGLAFGPSGNLYMVSGATGAVDVVGPSGGAASFFAASGIPNDEPQSIAFDSAGNLYMSEIHPSSSGGGENVLEFGPAGGYSYTVYVAGLDGPLAFGPMPLSVPEPSSLVLAGLGGVLAGAFSWWRERLQRRRMSEKGDDGC